MRKGKRKENGKGKREKGKIGYVVGRKEKKKKKKTILDFAVREA